MHINMLNCPERAKIIYGKTCTSITSVCMYKLTLAPQNVRK